MHARSARRSTGRRTARCLAVATTAALVPLAACTTDPAEEVIEATQGMDQGTITMTTEVDWEMEDVADDVDVPDAMEPATSNGAWSGQDWLVLSDFLSDPEQNGGDPEAAEGFEAMQTLMLPVAEGEISGRRVAGFGEVPADGDLPGGGLNWFESGDEVSGPALGLFGGMSGSQLVPSELISELRRAAQDPAAVDEQKKGTYEVRLDAARFLGPLFAKIRSIRSCSPSSRTIRNAPVSGSASSKSGCSPRTSRPPPWSPSTAAAASGRWT